VPLFVRGGLRYNPWLETKGRAPIDFPPDVITIDSEVNALHYDLHIRSAQGLLALAGVIAAGTIEPILKARVRELLRAGFESRQLDYRLGRDLALKVKAAIPGGDAPLGGER
jgi:hypothetical protein